MQVASHPLLTEQELLLVQKETEKILGYNFRTSSLLIEALTTPGSEGEDFQGHRWLGDFGIDVIRSCVTLDGYQKKAKPSVTANIKQRICSYPHLRTVAERTALDQRIIYNPRSGRGRPIIVGKALAAIIAAAHLDCGKDYERTWEIMRHIGLMIVDEMWHKWSWQRAD